MKVVVDGHEIVDAKISKISLVKHGAIRTPFKIVKTEYAPPEYAKVLPQEIPTTGSAYAESDEHPQHWEPQRYATERHGAQAAQIAANALPLRKDHSLDGMLRDARRRKQRGW
jgi:hypothetical protein